MDKILKELLSYFYLNRDSTEIKKILSILRQSKFKNINEVPSLWCISSKFTDKISNISELNIIHKVLALYAEFVQGTDNFNGPLLVILEFKKLEHSNINDKLITDLINSNGLDKQLNILRRMIQKIKAEGVSNLNFVEIYNLLIKLNNKDLKNEAKLDLANKYFL